MQNNIKRMNTYTAYKLINENLEKFREAGAHCADDCLQYSLFGRSYAIVGTSNGVLYVNLQAAFDTTAKLFNKVLHDDIAEFSDSNLSVLLNVASTAYGNVDFRDKISNCEAFRQLNIFKTTVVVWIADLTADEFLEIVNANIANAKFIRDNAELVAAKLQEILNIRKNISIVEAM